MAFFDFIRIGISIGISIKQWTCMEVRKSLENIDDFGFPDKDANLYTVSVHGERVTFAIEAGNYALVYSLNEKPTWLHSPDEDNDVKVRKIGDGWYHVLVVIN